LKNTESNLKRLEKRTQKLETLKSTASKDINDLKESLDFTGKETKYQMEALKKSQQDCESKLAELWAEIEIYDSKMEDLHTENLSLESYSRWENIKFMNINEEPSTNRNENVEDSLHNFLERELGFLDERSIEIQRTHQIGKREDKP